MPPNPAISNPVHADPAQLQTARKYIRKRSYLLFLSLLFSGISALAQIPVEGHVKDTNGIPISNVSVTVRHKNAGTTTNDKGHFRLPGIALNDTLVFSFTGYDSQLIVFRQEGELNIILKEDQKQLQDVVVIGYGKVRKGDATGSLVNVKIDDKQRGGGLYAQDLIVGRVPGVTIVNEGGAPTGASYIRIRGGSSLSASNDPLIIVDGVFMDNNPVNGTGNVLSTINPNDIESFTILKDASATAIYGSRASNGVILITTKKGSSGALRVSYDGKLSLNARKKELEVLSGDEFRVFLRDRYGNSSQYNEIFQKQGLINTDWQNAIFQQPLNTDNNLSVYGSVAKKHPFRLSVGSTQSDGILKTSSSKRHTASFSFSPSLLNNDLKVNLNGRGMLVNNRYANWDAIGAAVAMDPTQPVYDANSPYGGYYTSLGTDHQIIQVATKNPLSMLEMTNNASEVRNFIGSAQLDYHLRFLPGLHAILNTGIDYAKGKGGTYISEFSPSDYMYGGYNAGWNDTRRNSSLDFYLQYKRELSALNSHIDLMGGYSWQHYKLEGSNAGYRISNYDAFGDPLLVSKSKFATEHYILSYYGRLNYAFNNKYLFTFTLREDGSSRFSKENRWSLFPSAALAWKVSDEPFLKGNNTLSNLKLRLSWGITGQQDINQGDYPYIATYYGTVGTQANYLRGYTAGGAPLWVELLRPESYNANLKWESTTTYNAGIDYAFLKGRIEGAIDVYYRKTKDLINVETKTTAGTNFKEFVVSNIGSLENKGVEFSITGSPVKRKALTWELGANLTYNRNRITKLNAGDDSKTRLVNGIVVNMVGQATNMYYMYEQIYDEKGKPIEGFYKDQNSDGLINEEDLRPFKRATPDITLGLNTRLLWKAFDLSIAGHGSIGNYNYNALAAGNAALSLTSVYASEFLRNRMKSALETNFQVNQPLSDYYVQDASFFRVDNIILGWSFNKSKKLPLNGRVYGNVQNAFVFTKYKGVDPEIFGGSDGSIYPRPITFLLGLNLNF
ncbi:MAG: SusC/RagA family TonB-linked outer membrane protein [Pseudobacter sp.]|uniref:SusC/RagA family TonB-linked outer membrane protein n=1 Tax=Pseudobacter sp. TaxID=2045420 RepID=UPI003F7CD615